jgi:hypothetical protein
VEPIERLDAPREIAIGERAGPCARDDHRAMRGRCENGRGHTRTATRGEGDEGDEAHYQWPAIARPT